MFPLKSTVLDRDLGRIVSGIFGSGEQGAWYDPSDLTTLFQDSAGTVPVTAVEQPVGKMLDKSGRGNNTFQATSTKRPVYSRRVNLLTESEFRNGLADTTANSGLVAAASLAGYSGAIAFGYDGAAFSYAYKTFLCFSDAQYVFSLIAKADDGGSISSSEFLIVVNGGGVGTGATYTALGGGFYIVSYVFTGTGSAKYFGLNKYAASSNRTFKVTAYDLRLAIDAHLPYQRVNTATDYDADPGKFPAFRKEDGVDDSMSSSTDGGGNAGFFFSQAITVLGGAGTARTLFSDAGTNTGYIVRINTSNQLELAAGNGTAFTTIATAGTLAVGTTDVVQAWDDGVNLNVKIGTGAIASVARPVVVAGTAGYTLGQDNGAASGFFNGRSYGAVYRKDSAPTQVQREAVALYLRQKARLA